MKRFEDFLTQTPEDDLLGFGVQFLDEGEKMANDSGLEVKGGDRHIDRGNSDDGMIARLEQIIDGYVTSSGKPKARVLTIAIDGLTKRKIEFEKNN